MARFNASPASISGGKSSGILLGLLALAAAAVALKGWALMIAWGIVVAEVPGVEFGTIGFGPAVAVAVLLTMAFSGASASASRS